MTCKASTASTYPPLLLAGSPRDNRSNYRDFPTNDSSSQHSRLGSCTYGVLRKITVYVAYCKATVIYKIDVCSEIYIQDVSLSRNGLACIFPDKTIRFNPSVTDKCSLFIDIFTYKDGSNVLDKGTEELKS